MAQTTRSLNLEANVNVKAFLKVIRYAETKCEDNRAYYRLYGGGTFTDTSEHPLPSSKAIVDKKGNRHSPAGAYQITHPTWEEAKDYGIAQDFAPTSQDRIAIHLIQSSGALSDVLKGDVEKAIPKLRGRWSSLPGAKQQQITMEKARLLFSKYVQEYSKK